MARRSIRIALASCAASLGLLTFGTAGAMADTAIMGSALNLPYAGGVSTAAGTTTVQISQAGGMLPFPITSPANAVVTDWAVRTGDPDTLYVLRILHPNGGNSYTSVGRLPAPTAVPAGTTDSIIHYPGNNQPISLGDAIGLLQEGNPDVGIAQAMTNGIPTNIFSNHFNPDFSDGVPTDFTPDQQHELLLQATIKFCKVPDLTGKTLADAQAALTAADCGTATVTTKKLKKSKKNKKKKGTILSQTTTAGTTSAPGTAVEVTVAGLKKVKKAKKKH